MRIGTIMSVAVLAVSSAALAQVTTAPKKPAPANNMSMMNDSMPTNDTMNTHDESMMNDSSTPNSMDAPK